MKHPGFRALALGWCLCLLYVGYELARACSLALFASRAAGVNGAYTALSGFLLSIATLAMYGRGVELLGAKDTLLLSAGGCCALFLVFAGLLSAYESDAIPWSFVASLFALRECYVSLVGTQVWALLGAELKKKGTEISRSWFCIIQGVSCICSAFAGMAAGSLASSGGQFKLLLAAALSLAIITVTVALAMEKTFDGVGWDKSGDKKGKLGSTKRGAASATTAGGKGGPLTVLRSSASLFHRSPLLAALLAEAVVCQVLTATLNMSFNEAIRQSLGPQTPDTGARAAGFVGKSFAFIGLLSGVLQLLVMPWAMLRLDPSLLLSLLPLVAASGYLVTFVSPGFRSATAAFALTKILDYSVRGTALELVFQPMPDHERLLGKEAIATVGVRIGRTAAHVTLYCCSALMGSSAPQRGLMAVALAAAVLWAITLRRVQVLGKPGEISLRHSSRQSPSHQQQQQPQQQPKWKQDPPQLKLPKQQQRAIAKLDIGIECRSKVPKVGASAAGYSNGFSIIGEKGNFRRGVIVTRKLEGIVFANDSGNGTLTAVAMAGGSRSGCIDS